MEEAYVVKISKVRSAVPKPEGVIAAHKLELFKELAGRLDSFINHCLLGFYQDVLQSIRQLVSACASGDQSSRIEVLFTRGRCMMDWQDLFDQSGVRLESGGELLTIVPTDNNPLGEAIEALQRVKDDSMLVISLMQLDCFPRADFLECLLDAIAESGKRKVCFILNTVSSLDATAQRISRECFSRMRISVAHFPSSSLFVDRLFEGLVLADDNPLHPFCFDGLLLHTVRQRYLRVDNSTRELRKALLLGILVHCRDVDPGAAKRWVKLEPFQSDAGYRVVLRALVAFQGTTDSEPTPLLCRLHRRVMSEGFPSFYGELKGEWSKWSKEVWKARLKQLEEILSPEASMGEVATECGNIRYELDAFKQELVRSTSMRTTNLTQHLKEKSARKAEAKLTTAERERIFRLLDALFIGVMNQYVEDHDGFVIALPDESNTRRMALALFTQFGSLE